MMAQDTEPDGQPDDSSAMNDDLIDVQPERPANTHPVDYRPFTW